LKLPPVTYADLEREAERRKYFKLDYCFPDDARAGYRKHLAFFDSTAKFKETCFMAGNRVGKSEAGAFACAVWLTGLYPDWWTGKRFDRAVNILAAGETAKLVRDSMQIKLMGQHGDHGSGLIPRHMIVKTTPKTGVPEAIDSVTVKHVSGSFSTLQLQSYDQGREAFQATSRDVVWEDEEPPLLVHNECLIRTMTTRGLIMLTFTPLKGMSDTVLSISKKAEEGAASMVTATWDDAPHLSEDDKKIMIAALPPWRGLPRS
jgi:phage terminase large subunit-like protein